MNNVYCVFDKKSGFYSGLIFCEQAHAQALRGFDTAVNETGSILSKFPDDFELHCLGTWDKKTGVLLSDIGSLGSARTVLRQPELPGISRQLPLSNVQ